MKFRTNSDKTKCSQKNFILITENGSVPEDFAKRAFAPVAQYCSAAAWMANCSASPVCTCLERVVWVTLMQPGAFPCFLLFEMHSSSISCNSQGSWQMHCINAILMKTRCPAQKILALTAFSSCGFRGRGQNLDLWLDQGRGGERNSLIVKGEPRSAPIPLRAFFNLSEVIIIRLSAVTNFHGLLPLASSNHQQLSSLDSTATDCGNHQENWINPPA